jgi:hypothetical protein
MKRFVCTTAIVCLIAACQAGAAPLLAESFDYTQDQALTDQGGWQGSNSATVTAPNLEYAGVPSSGLAIENTTSSGTANTLDIGLPTDQLGVWWMSCLVDDPNETGTTQITAFATKGHTGTGIRIADGELRAFSGPGGYARGPQLGEGLYWLVCRIEYYYNATQDRDDVAGTVWVNPDPASEPLVADGTTITRGAPSRQSSVRIALPGDAATRVDELRVATSYADVVPEPATLSVLALGAIGLIRRRR